MKNIKLFLFFSLFITTQVSSLVIGIDLGSRFFKVGLLQAGKPYYVILNDESQRRTSTAVSLLGGNEREFGTQSQNNAVKKPEETFLLSTTVLGRSNSPNSLHWINESMLPYTFIVDESTNSYKIQIKNNTYRIEEIIAMLLQHAQKLASVAAGTKIKDAVLAVPPYFTQQQRLAILNAANIAGLTVTGLINDNTAVALLYGVEKESDFKDNENNRNVVFFDMGATSTKVSVVRYGGVQSKLDKKGNKTVGEYWIKSVTWDDTVGALTFDNQIVEMIATEFNKKQGVADGSDQDVRKNPVAVGKMRKNAEKAKEVLSTIGETFVTIEGLKNDVDFKMKLSRDVLYERCSAALTRIEEITLKALEQANLTIADIHSIELVGGGSRIPGVQTKLTGIFNLSLSMSLNGDDAVALGATLYAAKVSPAHRMREFSLRDVNPYPINVRLLPISPESGEQAVEQAVEQSSIIEKEIFSVGSKVPIVKKISLSRSEDFEIFVDYGKDAKLPAGTSHAISHHVFTGVSAAITKYQDVIVPEEEAPKGEEDEPVQDDSAQNTQQQGQQGSEQNKKLKIGVSLQINSNGMIEVSKTEGKLSIMSTEKESEVEKNVENASSDSVKTQGDKVQTPESEEKSENNSNQSSEGKKENETNETKTDSSDKKSEKVDETEPKAEPKAEGEQSAEASSSGDLKDNKEEKSKSEPIGPQKKVKHIRISVQDVPRTETGTLRSLNDDQIKSSVKTLTDLDKADQARKALAEVRNEIETKIYDSRDFLNNAENIELVCLEEDKEKMIEKLTQAEDWLYEDGLNGDIETFREKLVEVKDITSSVRHRYDEMVRRKELVVGAEEMIQTFLETAKNWTTTKPWLDAEDKEALVNKTLSFQSWLAETVEKQEKASLFEDPVLVSSEVYRKISFLQTSYQKMSKIRKPLPDLRFPTNSTGYGNWTKDQYESFKKKAFKKERQTNGTEKEETFDENDNDDDFDDHVEQEDQQEQQQQEQQQQEQQQQEQQEQEQQEQEQQEQEQQEKQEQDSHHVPHQEL